MNRQICAGILIAIAIFAHTEASMAEANKLEASVLVNGVGKSVQNRADVLAASTDIRVLKLREKSLERQLSDTEERVRIISTMASGSGDLYSLSKDFVMEHAPVLIAGCLIGRPFMAMRTLKNEDAQPVPKLDTRAASALCSMLDGVVTFVVTAIAASPQTASREALTQAFFNRPTKTRSYTISADPITYPKTVRGLRIGGATLAALFVVQQTLSWTYTDEINYRNSIEALSHDGVITEIQNQLKSANELSLELAATRAARYALQGAGTK